MSLSSPSPRQELLQIQKKIFARNNEMIRSQAMVRERSFEVYERHYRRHVRDFDKASTQEELLDAIRDSDVIYLGDYHTNPQSQRTLLRLLKLVLGSGGSGGSVALASKVGLGLELVLKRHQRHLDDYLKRRIPEGKFLDRVRFRKHWYFDLWENFKPIFEFARFHKMPVFGVEHSLGGQASLEKRDRKSGQSIADLLETHPGLKLVVFVGDLHVAPEHLPERVQESLREKGLVKKDLIVYQNSESIYWKLAEDEVEDKVEIVRVSPREFCIINTPPIVWQQSYLNWIEHEEGEIDYYDARHSFIDLLKRIAGFLGIKLPADADEIEVYTCGDLSFLKALSEGEGYSRVELKRIKKQVLASESYCIPHRRTVYLANLSINHASEEAAHYLKYLCAGAEEPRDSVDAFYANVLHEALGFFGSKIVNHKRKCFHEHEYLGLIGYLNSGKSSQVSKDRRLELEISLLVLKHRELDKKGLPIRSRQFFRSRHELFFGVTHGLGYMLGDRLYYALVGNRISKKEIRDIFYDSMKGEGQPYDVYRRLLRKVRGVKIPKRV